MAKHFKYLIIGAGPTGLGAGYRLRELGEKSFLIIEKSSHVGGLSASFLDERGFTWDIGGHVQFSHYPYFDNLMEKALGREGWLKHQRESWAWMFERFVPYPVQNNMRYFPREQTQICVQGLIELLEKPASNKPDNFREWILQVFGAGFASIFMFPYNYKVWAFPPEEMSYQWIGERVAITDVQRVLKNIILEKDDLSWGPNNTFQFPLQGGTGAIWENVANLLGRDSIRTQVAVTGVDRLKKAVTSSTGEVLTYDHLLTTVPLDLFCQTVRSQISTEIYDLSQKLRHSSSNIVGIGLKGKPSQSLATKCWMYFPEDNCPFYRTTVFSNYSPNNVPDINQHWSLMTETSESPAKAVDRKSLIEETIQGAMNTKLIERRSDILSTWMYTAEYGYPTPSLNRDAILKAVIPYLEKDSIYSRGRFGGWKYEVSNQDHSAMQGVEWANFVVKGEAETTFKV